jgi:hypothetical protein
MGHENELQAPLPAPAIDFQIPIPKEAALDPKRLGPRRRRMAALVVLIGMLTLVVPLVRTDQPVLGRTRWSPLNIVYGISAGTLPVRKWGDPKVARSDRVMFWFASMSMGFLFEYGTLVVIAGAVIVFPLRNVIGLAAVLGAASVWGELQFEYQDFQEGIFAAVYTRQVHAGVHCLTMMGVMMLFLIIAAWKELDD